MEIAVPIIVAILGFFAKYINDLRIQQRSERLHHITEQIEKFYGPLFVMSNLGRRLYDAYNFKAGFSDPESRTLEWKIWLKEVLVPLNTNMENIITKNAYLLYDNNIPSCLINFCAHAAVYRVILSKFECDNETELISIIPFPEDLETYLTKSYLKLKNEQLKLINNRMRGVRWQKK